MKRISFKVALAMLVLALIAIISLGLLANNTTAISSESQQVMNNEVEKINLIHGIYEDYLNISAKMYSHVSERQELTMESKSKEILECREEMWASMKAYETMISSDEAREVFDSLS